VTARILVADDDDDQANLISLLLRREGYTVERAEDGEAALRLVDAFLPDLVLLDVMMPKMHGFEVVQRLREQESTAAIPVIMLTAKSGIEDKTHGFSSGADDYITKPFLNAELLMRVRAHLRTAQRVVAVTKQEPPEIISVFSLKGGAGCTGLAVNVAAGLARMWLADTVLVDLSLPFGVCDMMLKVKPQRGLADLAYVDPAKIDFEMIEQNLTNHESGVRLLAGFSSIEDADRLTEDHVKKILEHLSKKFNYVVVDTSHDFQPAILAVLEASSSILMPCAPDISSVRVTVTALKLFQELGIEDRKIRLVVNWTFARSGLGAEQIARVLERKIDLLLVHDGMWTQSLNAGRPLILDDSIRTWVADLEDTIWNLSRSSDRESEPESPSPLWKRVHHRVGTANRAAGT
jgi:pilus assembly protein CpaE